MGENSHHLFSMRSIIDGNDSIVTDSYTPLGPPTTTPTTAILICSNYNKSILISLDGINDHIFVPALTVMPLILCPSKINSGMLQLKIGSQFYIKRGPDQLPNKGHLYITLINEG